MFFVHVAEVVISPLHLILLLIVNYGAVTGENGLVDALVRIVGLLVGVFDFDGGDLITTILRLIVQLYQLLLFIYSWGSYDFWQF